jgi:hypothetical protein
VSDERGPGYEYFVSPQLPETAPPPGARSGRDSSWALNPGTFHHHPVPTGTGMPKWLLGVAVLVGALLTVSLVAAVAIPVFLSQRAKAQWGSTSIALPDTFQGAPRISTPTLEQLASATGGGYRESVVGAYRRSPTDLMLIIAAKPRDALTASDQERARAGFRKGFTSSSNGVDIELTQQKDAGKLGGWFGCGAARSAKVCVATDAGSLVAVVMGPGVQDPAATARAAREATVRR